MKYIIHRGITSKNIKENSYLAIKKAIKDKESIGVELDIRLTKDKKIILSHNSLINLNVIEETNYSELIKNNYLTTLDKILDIDTNKIFLIDIKTNNNYKVFGDILMNTLNKYNKNIYLASFDKNIIKYIKSKYKKGIITLLYRRNNYNFIITNYKLISNNKIKTYHHYFYEIDDEIKGEYFTLNELLGKPKERKYNSDIINFIKAYYDDIIDGQKTKNI